MQSALFAFVCANDLFGVNTFALAEDLVVGVLRTPTNTQAATHSAALTSNPQSADPDAEQGPAR
jgi:hypothetical protein